MKYEKIFSFTRGCEKIKYGIIYGNEKIVFIKTGIFGNIRGYKDKYPNMAHRIHERIGATVICSSNPSMDDKIQHNADKALIGKVVKECGFGDYEIYFVGTSDGGYKSLLLCAEFAQTAKYLGINSSHKGLSDFKKRIEQITYVEKIFVYGTEDDDYDSIVHDLHSLSCDAMRIISLEGVDHKFTGRVSEFIELIDLL